MKTKAISAALAFALAFAANLSAAAGQGADDPREFLKTATGEIITLLYDTPNPEGKSLVEVLRPIVPKYLDPAGITRRTIGPTWRTYSEAERARVTELFTDVVLRTYGDSFEPGERPEVSYGEAQVISNPQARPVRSEVATVISYAGKKYNVSLRVEQGAAGWRIYDIIAEGVSLISNYRGQLEPITKRGGAKAVIAALEKNLADLNAKRVDVKK